MNFNKKTLREFVLILIDVIACLFFLNAWWWSLIPFFIVIIPMILAVYSYCIVNRRYIWREKISQQINEILRYTVTLLVCLLFLFEFHIPSAESVAELVSNGQILQTNSVEYFLAYIYLIIMGGLSMFYPLLIFGRFVDQVKTMVRGRL